MILITIASTTYPTKLGNFQNGGFFILDNVSIRDIFLNFFSEFLIVIIVVNRTLCRLIGSVIILLLDKSHSASQSSDLSVTRMITNWNLLGHITIINTKKNRSGLKDSLD